MKYASKAAAAVSRINALSESRSFGVWLGPVVAAVANRPVRTAAKPIQSAKVLTRDAWQSLRVDRRRAANAVEVREVIRRLSHRIPHVISSVCLGSKGSIRGATKLQTL
jgi:hypothetical protein